MIPHVFVSSTIQDLQYLRDGIRDTIVELGYHPVMSDYGEIGYLPDVSAIEACQRAMRQCQLAVVIIGKRYGSETPEGLSVTQAEYRAACAANVAIFCLVDREVSGLRQVFEDNRDNGIKLRSIDNAKKLFGFLDEVRSRDQNNGTVEFTEQAGK